ncbi:MAG: membrane integrity-associated transporter subunit PqiC [Rhodobacteraceae bacterium]|nr:membrane integrity-associated transporter subunit PqiC [Paracoccaceae bacterium]
MTALNRRSVLALTGALALTGCGGLLGLGEATRPLDAYELRVPGDIGRAPRSIARSLVIETPESTGGLATDRIMIRPNPLQAAYLPRARWTDEAPVMVRGLLVRAFEDTNALRHVGRRALPGGISDFTLITDLTDFQAELRADDTVQVRVRLTARLVRDDDGQVLATRVFQALAPAASDEALAIVEAFDSAMADVLRALAPWALERLGVRLAAGA